MQQLVLLSQEEVVGDKSLVQKTIEYNPQANIMDKEQVDRMREEYSFELNIVIQEEIIIAARLYCFSTEEEEDSQD